MVWLLHVQGKLFAFVLDLSADRPVRRLLLGGVSLCEIANLPVAVGPLSARADASTSCPATTPCVSPFTPRHTVGVVMSRYLAPVGFALAACWVAVLFYLVGSH